jgi:hypothetical protein
MLVNRPLGVMMLVAAVVGGVDGGETIEHKGCRRPFYHDDRNYFFKKRSTFFFSKTKMKTSLNSKIKMLYDKNVQN